MANLSEIEVIARNAACQAIKDFRAEEKKKEKKAILHNTEVLLKNYLELKDFFENTEESDIVCDEEIVVGSLRKDKITSRILYHHIESRMKHLRVQEPKKAIVLDVLYADPEYKDLAWQDKFYLLEEKFGVSQATAYRWKSDLIEMLGVKLFGADGLRIWTVS